MTAPAIQTQDLGDRTKYLGGSDAAAALGISKWKSRAELWLEKTGRIIPPELDSGPALWGTLLEDPVAQHWARETGMEIRPALEEFQHPEHPFIRGHLDRIIEGSNRFLEVKTTGAWNTEEWGETGSDQIPLDYRVQLATYFSVTPFEVAEVAVLIGGQEFRHYTVERDDELVSTVVDALAAFWTDYVVADREPPPISVRDASKIWPEDCGEEVELDPSDPALEAFWEYEDLRLRINELEEQRETCRAILAERMGDSPMLRADGVKLAQFKNETRMVLDSQRMRTELPHLYGQMLRPSRSRVLRVSKPTKNHPKPQNQEPNQ